MISGSRCRQPYLHGETHQRPSYFVPPLTDNVLIPINKRAGLHLPYSSRLLRINSEPSAFRLRLNYLACKQAGAIRHDEGKPSPQARHDCQIGREWRWR